VQHHGPGLHDHLLETRRGAGIVEFPQASRESTERRERLLSRVTTIRVRRFRSWSRTSEVACWPRTSRRGPDLREAPTSSGKGERIWVSHGAGPPRRAERPRGPAPRVSLPSRRGSPVRIRLGVLTNAPEIDWFVARLASPTGLMVRFRGHLRPSYGDEVGDENARGWHTLVDQFFEHDLLEVDANSLDADVSIAVSRMSLRD